MTACSDFFSKMWKRIARTNKSSPVYWRIICMLVVESKLLKGLFTSEE